jgi:hypothetical protein
MNADRRTRHSLPRMSSRPHSASSGQAARARQLPFVIATPFGKLRVNSASSPTPLCHPDRSELASEVEGSRLTAGHTLYVGTYPDPRQAAQRRPRQQRPSLARAAAPPASRWPPLDLYNEVAELFRFSVALAYQYAAEEETA